MHQVLVGYVVWEHDFKQARGYSSPCPSLRDHTFATTCPTSVLYFRIASQPLAPKSLLLVGLSNTG